MKLHFQFFPSLSKDVNSESERRNIVILHGLFGSSKNWTSVGKDLSGLANVYALDLRNHGNSPHTDSHTIPEMAEDLKEFLTEKKIDSPILLGHSMGGLVAMYFCLKYFPQLSPKETGWNTGSSDPSMDLNTENRQLDSGLGRNRKPSGLIVQDISPRSYPFIYDSEIQAMSFDISRAESRNQIDEKMKEFVPDLFIRQFLQMNLERLDPIGYRWKLNVPVIYASRSVFDEDFSGFLEKEISVDIPSLFVLGGDSPYIRSEDPQRIKKFFPKSRLEKIPGGGHYIQYTHKEKFLTIITNWILSGFSSDEN
jgi:pimeloyl-ACP methyl ester carboxylesterase